MSIRRRILVTFTLIVVVGGVVQMLIAGSQLQSASLDYYQQHLETDALLAAASFASPFEARDQDGDSAGNLQRTLVSVHQEVGHDEFGLIDNTGHVVASSGGLDYPAGAVIPATSEFTQAQAGIPGIDIRTDATGAERMYVAAPIHFDHGVIGYMVVSQPMQPIYDEIRTRWLGLIVTTLPVIALVIAASLWISTSISRPIQKLRNSALKMARGAFDTRIDVTSKDELGQLAHTFNYLAEEIEKLLRTQRSFVSNAAHELRNPLMTLKLRIEALQEGALSDAQRETYVAELGQEVTRMSDLVNSLLVLARVDEGRHQPDNTPYDGAALLHDLARHWRIEAHQAHLDFDAKIDPDLPDFPIPANDLRLVLDNLLSNAVKYTPQGGVTLQASKVNGALKLSVADTGHGFSPQEADQLFTRFYRTPESRERQIPGTGLGLAIAEAVVEYYHGTIQAQSAGEEKGAAFTVTLPLPASAA